MINTLTSRTTLYNSAELITSTHITQLHIFTAPYPSTCIFPCVDLPCCTASPPHQSAGPRLSPIPPPPTFFPLHPRHLPVKLCNFNSCEPRSSLSVFKPCFFFRLRTWVRTHHSKTPRSPCLQGDTAIPPSTGTFPHFFPSRPLLSVHCLPSPLAEL